MPTVLSLPASATAWDLVCRVFLVYAPSLTSCCPPVRCPGSPCKLYSTQHCGQQRLSQPHFVLLPTVTRYEQDMQASLRSLSTQPATQCDVCGPYAGIAQCANTVPASSSGRPGFVAPLCSIRQTPTEESSLYLHLHV